jgi:integrase
MACKVKVNRHGYLAFRFYWNGREFWQGTGWRDTAKNRTKAEGKAVEITEEIKVGTFNYLKWFPKGNKAHEFAPKDSTVPAENKPLTVRRFYEEWIEKKKPPFVRLSLQRDYQQNFKRNILPFMGDTELNRVTVETLENFRIHLVDERHLAVKTARNIIDGSLRAMIRDASILRRIGQGELTRAIERNPFNDLPDNWWPRLPQREPDPYTEQERDSILAYYRGNRPAWAYAFVFFRFWTGTRPSEATALKWGSVDLINAKATFALSRHLGEENAPKTRASRRTVKLLPNVVNLLQSTLPLRVEPNSYVFLDGQGKPIDQSEFARGFQAVLRVLKLRPRPFYNLRHTFISIALTLGCNQKWIAEQTGTSVQMIQEHYGKYIRDDGDVLLRAYLGSPKQWAIEQKTETFPETFSRGVSNFVNNLASPTGFEPVLSA